MKNAIAFLVISLASAMSAASNGKALSNAEFAQVLRQIDHAATLGDIAKLCAMFEEMDHYEVWSFGAGLGPTTSESVQFMIVRILWQHSATVKKGNKPPDWIANPLLRTLIGKAADERDILPLLVSTNAAVRAIGVLECDSLDKLGDRTISELKTIALEDGFVQLTRVDLPSEQAFDAWESRVSFPLRVLSSEILKAKGINVCQTPKTIASDGAFALAKMWDAHPERRQDIQMAVSLLPKAGQDAEAIHDLAQKQYPSEAIEVLYGAIKP